MNMFYCCGEGGQEEYTWSRKPYPVDDGTPYLGSFTFKDIDCEGVEVCAGWFDGLPERPIEKVSVINSRFIFVEGEKRSAQPALANDVNAVSGKGFYFNNVNYVRIKNVAVENVDGEKFIFENCKEKEIN